MSFLKTDTIKYYGKQKRDKKLYGGGKKQMKHKIKKQFEDKIIKNTKIFSHQKKKLKQSNREKIYMLTPFLRRKRSLQQEWVMFGALIILNVKVLVTEIKPYQSKNTLM